MKKIIWFLMSLLVLSIAYAIDQPDSDSGLMSTLEQPLPPSGTGNVGECTPWETKDYECKGDISSYMQCFKTATGGVWQLKQIDCKDYGESVDCIAGKCVREGVGLPIDQQYQTFIIIGLIIFIVILLRRK